MDSKIYVLLFILFLLVKSRPVVKTISRIKGTTDESGNLNNYGLIAQGILLVVAYMILESLVNNDFL